MARKETKLDKGLKKSKLFFRGSREDGFLTQLAQGGDVKTATKVMIPIAAL